MIEYHHLASLGGQPHPQPPGGRPHHLAEVTSARAPVTLTKPQSEIFVRSLMYDLKS